jgi:hypothetical protein
MPYASKKANNKCPGLPVAFLTTLLFIPGGYYKSPNEIYSPPIIASDSKIIACKVLWFGSWVNESRASGRSWGCYFFMGIFCTLLLQDQGIEASK